VHVFHSLLIVAAATAGAVAAASLPTSHGPLPAHTGGFNEPTCHRCHSDYPLNDGKAFVRFDSLPAFYQPGVTYSLRLRVQHAELKRAGFQLSARFEDGTAAGSFLIADTILLRIQRSAGTDYLSHAERGTFEVRADTAEWTFKWTAPQSDRRILFHAAVNASNNDASEFGDRIFTAQFASGGESVRK
jgi:hypothetical protein